MQLLTWQRCSGLPQLAATFSRVSGVTCGRSVATTSAAARANAMATTPGCSDCRRQNDKEKGGRAGGCRLAGAVAAARTSPARLAVHMVAEVSH